MVAEMIEMINVCQGIRRNTPASGSSSVHHCVGALFTMRTPRFVSRAAIDICSAERRSVACPDTRVAAVVAPPLTFKGAT